MRTIARACGVAACVFLAAPSWAGTMSGLGGKTCESLTEQWKAAGSSERVVLLKELENWALGYMTGKNTEVGKLEQKNIAVIDGEALSSYIVELCENYSDQPVLAIVEAIYRDLDAEYSAS
jgi:hypothetical protein